MPDKGNTYTVQQINGIIQTVYTLEKQIEELKKLIES